MAVALRQEICDFLHRSLSHFLIHIVITELTDSGLLSKYLNIKVVPSIFWEVEQ